MRQGKINNWMLYTLLAAYCLLGGSVTSLHAQNVNNSDKKVGYQLLKDKNYNQACIYLEAYHKVKPADQEAKLKLAIAQYHNNKTDQATIHINELLDSEKLNFPKALLYKAYLLHDAAVFSEAINFYKQYLRADRIAANKRTTIKHLILNCANGLRLQYQTKSNSAQNLGTQINSNADEMLPVPSPNYDDLVYFSSERLGSWDIYGATFSRDGQGTTDLFPLELNSEKTELLIDFNQAGSAIRFLRKSAEGQIQILVDTFRQEDVNTVRKFPEIKTPFTTDDKTLFFVSDSVLIFASNRLEGYGGYDLFLSRFIGDRWSEPKNMGTPINSAQDETSPFLATDGLTLYFSSNALGRSTGGFDIFKCKFDIEKEEWQSTENLGLAINSAQDDMHFRLSKNGLQAFFSSNRWNGQGGQDIYLADMNNTTEEMIPSTPVPFWQVKNYKQTQLIEQQEEKFKKKEGLFYRILATTQSKLDSSILPKSHYPNRRTRPSSDGQQFMYFVGLYRTFRSAQQLQFDLHKAGWPEARIMPYVNGIQLREEEIQNLLTRYTDLENFIKYN